jgi:hypothetical protein
MSRILVYGSSMVKRSAWLIGSLSPEGQEPACVGRRWSSDALLIDEVPCRRDALAARIAAAFGGRGVRLRERRAAANAFCVAS